MTIGKKYNSKTQKVETNIGDLTEAPKISAPIIDKYNQANPESLLKKRGSLAFLKGRGKENEVKEAKKDTQTERLKTSAVSKMPKEKTLDLRT
jgi:hypothetical protein